MKKSLSILLSIAMAFSIFASVAMGAEANLSTEAKYEALVKAGIFSGFEDGQAHLDEDMTRAQFAKVLSLTFGLEENVAASAVYIDLDGSGWAAGFIGAVTKAGLMNGRSANEFAPTEAVKTEELATVLVRAFNLQPSTSGVTGNVSDWARGYVGAALQNGLIAAKADYTQSALRADLVESAYVVYEIVQSIQQPEVAFKPTSNKTIEVSFSKPVDKDKVTFEVKNSVGNTVSATAKNWNADSTKVTLETAVAMMSGVYNITVKNAAANDLTGSVTITEDRVTGIEILSDVAPVERNDGYRIINATVHYRVLNQYGQDVTRTTNIQWFTSIGGDKGITQNNDGTLTIDINPDNYFYQVGSEFTLSGNIVGTAVNVSKTLKLGEEAKPTHVEVIGLYSDGDKTLNLNSNYEDFYVLFNVKDQYNNPIKFDKLQNQLTVYSSRQDLIPMSNVVFTNAAGENRNQLALQLQGFEDPSKINKNFGGTAILTFAQKFGGQLATYSIDVKKAAIVSKFNMTVPEGTVAVGDGTVEIKYTALDEDGNAVKNVDILTGKGGYYGVNVAGAEFDKDGKLIFTVPDRTGPVTIYANVLSTNQQASITINVQEKKYPAAITGTKSYDTILANVATTFKGEDFKVVDQYGGEIKTDNFFKNYKIKVEVTRNGVTEATYKLGAKEIFELNRTEKGNIEFTASAILSEKVPAKDKDGKDIMSDDINVQYGYGTRNFTALSVKDFTVRYVDWKDIASFEIGDVKKLYSNAEDKDRFSVNTESVSVYGKLSNGTKVNIGKNYVLSTDTKGISIVGDSSVAANDQIANYVGSESETKGLLLAVILKPDASPQATKEVVISKATPVVSKVELKKVEITEANLRDYPLFTKDNGLLTGLKAVDQYGIEQVQFKKDASVIISEVKHGKDNGSTLKAGRVKGDEKISGAKAGDTFVITVVVGGQTVKANVEVK